MKERVISPPRKDWKKLRQPLQSGEIFFINWIDRFLDLEWEIYIQPHLNGCCPDVVILNPSVGIGVFEVKDWNFDAMNYYIKKNQKNRLHLMAEKRGEVISFVKNNPVDQLLLYRREILDLYCPILSENSGALSVTCGLILPNANYSHFERLIKPIFNDRGRNVFDSKHHIKSNYFVMTSESFSRELNDVIPDSICRSKSKYMNYVIASALRVWLVEPDAVKEQRDVLKYNKKQQDFIFTRTKSGYRRIRGAAGSGKSIVVAGKAANLLQHSKKVLVVTFNITLLNYLQDLAVRVYPKARKEGVWLNFHALCKRLCYSAGMQESYSELFNKNERADFPDNSKLCEMVNEAIDIIDDAYKYDAILVDEGQDFKPDWWEILRRLLLPEGEMLLVADSSQDIYGVSGLWTDDIMNNAGFRGGWAELDETYRLPDNLIPIANNFAQNYLRPEKIILSKKVEDQLVISLEGANQAQLRWLYKSFLSEDVVRKVFIRFKADVGICELSASDITILVQNNEIGKMVCQVLLAMNVKNINIFDDDAAKARVKKNYFFKGDSRVKVCTVHSFKGWESKAILIFFGSLVEDADYSLLYTAITRLKSGLGSIMYVVCSDQRLSHFENEWKAEYSLKRDSLSS
jgi:hypothetical protein